MTLAAPILTRAPTIEYAPTSASAASSAVGSMSAVGCIRGVGLGTARALLRNAHRRHQVGFGDDLAVDFRADGKFADAAHHPLHLGLEDELVAGPDLLPEARIVDRREEDDRPVAGRAAGDLPREDRRELRERLDHEYSGHHGVAREMALEERLVHRHVLDAADRFVLVELDDAIDEQERV